MSAYMYIDGLKQLLTSALDLSSLKLEEVT